jgi:hypothetical protein
MIFFKENSKMHFINTILIGNFFLFKRLTLSELIPFQINIVKLTSTLKKKAPKNWGFL